MDAITVRCNMCKHAMTFSADKAGKRAKCKKCDAINVIEPAKEPEKKKKKSEDDAPPADAIAEADPKPAPSDLDAAEGSYGVYTDPELEKRKKELAKEMERDRKKKDKKVLPKVTRKVRAIADKESWAKVRFGLIFLLVGTILWGLAHILQGSYVLVGTAEKSEFAELVVRNLEVRGDEEFPARGRVWDLDRVNIYLGMISGRNFLTYARVCLIVASLLHVLQAACWGVGYLMFLPVPRRFGMFGQAICMVGLAVLNFLFMVGFKLLPALGVHGYVLIPYVTPEICMVEYNAERIVPIHVMWMGAPFWESMLNMFVRLSMYMEPMFACIFIWSAGKAIKDETVTEGGRSLTRMIFGTAFVHLTFTLIAMCGASPVLVMVLRVIYVLWYFFVLLYVIQYILLLLKTFSVLGEKISPKNELLDADKDDKD